MTHETEKRVIAFVRSLARECGICLRRNSSYCDGCPSQWATRLMHELVREEKPEPQIDYSYYARAKRILAAIRKADRPLLAREINLDGLCSASLKGWTLQQMTKMGVLGRTFSHVAKSGSKSKSFFLYYIKNKKGKTK